jgi:hypothetical protein
VKDFRGGAASRSSLVRTDRDLSMKVVLIGCFGLVIAIMLASPLHMNLVGALLIVLLGFLFVTVSSRLTGEIGSTSNPISGMTVATLLLTCLVFLAVGWTGPSYYVTALSVGAIVCIASSNGGTTSQDLKTGFLIGATPRNQQIAILVGSLISAIVLGPILLTLNDAATVYVPRISKEPVVTGGATTLQDVENFPATLKVDPSTLTARMSHDGTEYLVWQKTTTDDGTGGKVSRGPLGNTGVPGGSRDQRRAPPHAGRHARGGEVRRPESHADVLHHQGHPQPAAPVGAGPAGGDDLDHPRNVGGGISGVRRRRIPAALLHQPDFPRRHGAMAERPVRQKEAQRPLAV